MRLNPDCVRDILLVVENETTATHRTAYPSKEFDTLDEKYNPDVVLYHVIQCMEYGYFRDAEHLGHMGILIPDLSPVGHVFLANIRKDNVWNGVKGVAEKVGTTSLSALTQIAGNVITEIIKAQFGLGSAPI